MPSPPMPSSSFCVVPWLHRLVDERGFLKVCCVAEGRDNFLTDAGGKRLHVQDKLPDVQIFNSPRLVGLRRDMLDGRWDPMCERCRAAEEASGQSSRTGRNNHLRTHIPRLLSETASDGTITAPRVRHLDMRLGNHCNLTCRMCSPGASKLWIEPYNRVQPSAYRVDADRLMSLRAIEWFRDPAVWQAFRDRAPDLEWLHFAGGEPMMVPQMIDALRMCVEAGVSERIDLSYTTNITLLPDEVQDLWPRFKSVSLNCSVDGYGAMNEYIRRPSKWRDVDRHLRTLDRHFHEWNLREVSITTTVQVYNVLDLDALYAYLRSGFEHVHPLPLLNPLSWPAYLSVQTLPRAVKERARDKLLVERTRPEYTSRPDLGWVLRTIDVLLAHMAPDLSGQERDFAHFTSESEQAFGDSLERIAPELAGLLSGATKP